MLTLLAALALATPPAAPLVAGGASVTCADAPATCEPASSAARVPAASTAVDAEAQHDLPFGGPTEYATPAEVDCPTPAGEVASGECSAPTPLYRWYGVSRLSDGEQTTPSLRTAPRRPRVQAALSSLPSDPARPELRAGQPIALQEPSTLFIAAGRADLPVCSLWLPARALAPPDRPPRSA